VADEVDFAPLLELRSLQPPGAPDVVARILTRFFTESSERVTALRAAVEANNAPALERAAHALKGAAGTVGAHAAGDLALRLERIGREGRIQDAAPLVMELDSALSRARTMFQGVLDKDIHDRT
jgi:HPt (histidine-containing phosphotransfer) domain-containing protein